MASFEHEKARLYALVDKFLENCDADGEMLGIDQACILAIGFGEDGDGDLEEQPIWMFETKKPHVHLGIFRAALVQAEEKFR